MFNTYVNVLFSDYLGQDDNFERIKEASHEDRVCMTKLIYGKPIWKSFYDPSLKYQVGIIVTKVSMKTLEGDKELRMIIEERGLFEEPSILLEDIHEI